jgi:DNA-binding FadR family transcriptional regulator
MRLQRVPKRQIGLVVWDAVATRPDIINDVGHAIVGAIVGQAMETTASSPRGARSIALKLQEAITSGAFGYREQLPTERQLAMNFGASRTTIRKALTWLEDQKLVERRAGSGTYASYERQTSSHDIAELTSPLELIEVRAAVEPQMARLAVLHATARGLDELQALLVELKAAEQTSDAARFSSADEQFHMAVAACTANPLLVWVYKEINVIRTHAQWGEMRKQILTRECMHLYNEQHEALVRAIQMRDAAGAAHIMVKHMDKARDDLIGANSR